MRTKKTPIPNTKASKVYLQDGLLCLEHKRTGNVYYMTPKLELIKVFQNYTVTPNLLRYLRVKIYINGERRSYILHDLAMAAYTGILRSDDFFASMEEYRIAKGDGVTVDHLDGIKTNNTVYNLSWMNESPNTRKQDIVSRLKLPHGIALAYYDGLYLVGMLWTKVNNTVPNLLASYGITAGMRGGIGCMYFLCKSAEDLVELITENLVSIEVSWSDTAPTLLPRKQKGKRTLFRDNAIKSINYQRALVEAWRDHPEGFTVVE